MIRALIKVGIGVFVAVFAAKQIGNVAKDLSRYNAMREMSGDGPLRAEQFKDAIKPTASAAPSKGPGPVAAALGLLGSVPSDYARYMKLRSM